MTNDDELSGALEQFLERLTTPAPAPAEPAPAAKTVTRKVVERDEHNRIRSVTEVTEAADAYHAKSEVLRDVQDTCPDLLLRIAKSATPDPDDVARLRRSVRALLRLAP